MLVKISAFTIFSATVIVLARFILGEWLLVTMSGPAYLPAYTLLLLLGGAAAIEMAGVSFDPLLMTIDRQRLTVFVRVAEVLVLGLCLALLLPSMGAAGAATSVLIATLVGFLLRAAAVRVHLR